jgi:[acyl-carrier-protein] S-malonyltransferase
MTSQRIGVLFPGQGSQFVGMGRDVAEGFPLARETFREADDSLGIALSRLAWEGPDGELVLTKNAQPAILVHSLAVWRVVEDRLPGLPVAIGAGHSLGEFSAYAAAGALSFTDAVRAVRRRGELMFRSGEERPGTMAAVIGLADDGVRSACEQATREGSVVVPANYNSPGQVVISGDAEAVDRVGPLLKEAGAKRVLPLNVSGAFHSPLMATAENGLREHLEAVEMRGPRFPVVANASAAPVTEADGARRLLIEQLTSPVRWTESVQAMAADGITRFLEVGPGNVLAGLLRRIDRSLSAVSVGTAEELNTFLEKGEEAWS